MQNKRKDIDELLSAQVEKRIKENRERLSPIVKCILHCGKLTRHLEVIEMIRLRIGNNREISKTL
jgi:hypothetical protein